MDLNLLAQQVHEANKAKGFWDKERNLGELFMLIVSELGEALEAHRKGKFADWEGYSGYDLKEGYNPETFDPSSFAAYIKDTFEDEIADSVIRILDYVGSVNNVEINLDYYKKYWDFDTYDNIGEALFEVNKMLVDSFFWAKRSDASQEKDLNGALVLLFDIATKHNFDLMKHIDAKIKYNECRPKLHGKAY